MTTDQASLGAQSTGAATPQAWAGWLLGIIATVGFSLATPISRNVILYGASPSVLLILRLSLASCLMGATWTIYRPESLRWSRRALFIVCGLGLLSGASSLAYNWSLTWLDASMAVMIFAVNPVVALSYLWLGGERMTIRQIVRLLLALVGVYLLIGPGGEVNLWGVLLVVFAMLAWSAQMVGAQWWLRDRDPGAVSFYSTASSLWVVFGYWWVRGEEFHVPGLHSWLLIILLVVIATFVARFSFYGAIQKIGSGQMALLMPVETMLAVTWSMFFLGERLSWLQGIGAFFILTSAILAFKRLGRIRIPGRWKAIVPME